MTEMLLDQYLALKGRVLELRDWLETALVGLRLMFVFSFWFCRCTFYSFLTLIKGDTPCSLVTIYCVTYAIPHFIGRFLPTLSWSNPDLRISLNAWKDGTSWHSLQETSSSLEGQNFQNLSIFADLTHKYLTFHHLFGLKPSLKELKLLRRSLVDLRLHFHKRSSMSALFLTNALVF